MNVSQRAHVSALLRWSLLTVLAAASLSLANVVQADRQIAGAHGAFESPVPEKTPIPGKPATWVFPEKDEARQFGAVTVILPAGFTAQGGANVVANLVPSLDGIAAPRQLVPGTIFALGIWPANEQLTFDKPISLKLLLNGAQIPPGGLSGLLLVRYDPTGKTWVTLPSRFRAATYELETSLQTFSPVAKDFPNWGGRTLFAAVRDSRAAPAAAAAGPTARRNANLRGGPGTTYPIVGSVAGGDELSLNGRNADGTWVRLADGSWIAAFLVSSIPDLPVVTPAP